MMTVGDMLLLMTMGDMLLMMTIGDDDERRR